MAARKRAKKQTLAEFRAWLEGMEEIQPEDWAPNAVQWKTIRAKINNVVEPKPSVDAATIQKLLEGVTNPPSARPAPQPQHGNPYPMQAAHMPPPPPPVGGVPQGPVVPAQANAQQHTSPPMLPPGPEVDIVSAAKPNLDNSDGNFSSSFS